jgi:hypothetical protein
MGTVVVKRSYQSKQGNRVRCAKNDGARRGGSRTAPAAPGDHYDGSITGLLPTALMHGYMDIMD